MRLVIPLLLLAVAACKPSVPDAAPAPTSPVALDKLLGQLNERLALMETVAAFKFIRKLPIADPQREAALLKQLEEKAKAYQLSASEVRWFFGAQIEAAKALQEIHFKRWENDTRGPPKAESLDEMRRRIDAVNDALLVELAEFRKSPVDFAINQERTRELIRGPGIDENVRRLASRC